MKKQLAIMLTLIFAISLLAACGGNGSTGDENTPGSGTSTPASDAGKNTDPPADPPAKSVADVIDVSTLLTAADLTAILGQSVEEKEWIDYAEISFITAAVFESEDYTFDNQLAQEAGWDKDDWGDSDTVGEKGWEDYIQRYEQSLADKAARGIHTQTVGDTEVIINIVKVDMLHDATAYLQEGYGFGQWLLYVFYGDYKLMMTLGNQVYSLDEADIEAANHNSEDEIAWKQDKLKEAGNLAVERLKAIIG